MPRPSYALATRTKDKLGVVGQLVDGATSVVCTENVICIEEARESHNLTR